jgi:hypothetical protein
MANREQKIENLLKLIKGEINPEELKPKRLCMYIGYSRQPIYAINEKPVSEDEFNKWSKVEPADYGTCTFNVIYGEGNDCPFVTLQDYKEVDDE